MRPDAPHLPHLAPIEAYGNGGFRFAGMSHRGSLLCLPGGIWAWPVRAPAEINEASLALAPEHKDALDFFILGTGRDLWVPPQRLRQHLREAARSVDAMSTGAAVRTFNVLLAENRRVGAALIAVD